jgi:glycosyltransferase involved in cell wall biosynthesis
MAGIALHIYPSTLQFESRIFKMAQSQIESGRYDHVIIAGIGGAGLPEKDSLKPGITRERIKLTWPRFIPGLKSLIFYAELYHRLFWRYRNLKPSLIQCHNLYVLLPCVLLKWATGGKLIYDAHELETESFGLARWRKKWAKLLEKTLIPHADRVLVVSPNIAQWYKEAYHLQNVTCICNMPYAVDLSEIDQTYFHACFSLPKAAPVFIYVGVLNTGRSIAALLEAFAQFPDYHLVLMGYGKLEGLIKQYSARYTNIHFHPAVAYDKVAKYAAAADVGIVLSENICLSYYYGYANKQFEYVQAGLAIVASDFPDMGGFVKTHQIGWVCSPEKDEIVTWLQHLNPADIAIFKQKSKAIRPQLTWEKEGIRYLDAIDVL